MPREISGLRLARSYITPTASEVSRELDFQLGARQGIAIYAVSADMVVETYTPGVLATGTHGTHTLHLETGSLETVPDAAGEDEDTIDSEVFFRQSLDIVGWDDIATEFRAAISHMVTPAGLITFPRPIFTARNITHRGISIATTITFFAHVILYYTFVEFSLAELGLILARRQ